MKTLGLTVLLFACAPLEQCFNPACWGVYPYPYSRDKPTETAKRPADFQTLAGKYTSQTTLSDGTSQAGGTGSITISRSGKSKAVFRAAGGIITPVGVRPFTMVVSLKRNRTSGTIDLPGLGNAVGTGTYKGHPKGLNFTIQAPVADTVATVTGKVRKRGKKMVLSGTAVNGGGTMLFTLNARQKN
jgi:hypothetical protein